MVTTAAGPERRDADAGRRTGAPSVLIVTAHFPPNRRPGTHRLLRFARDLDALGCAVSVLTLDPASYQPGVPIDVRLLNDIPRDVQVVRTFVPGRPRRSIAERSAPPPAPSTPSRPAPRVRSGLELRLRTFWNDLWSTPDHELGWWWSAVPAGMRLVRQGRVDVVFSSAPPFTCHLVAAEIARRGRLPWVADFRDPWSRAPWVLDRRGRGWTGWVHTRLERLTIRRASRVVLNTTRMQEDFALHYPPETARKFVTISNGFDSDNLERGLRPIARTAPEETLVICHTGSLYQARDPRPLFRALAGLRQRGAVPPAAFRLQLVGGRGDEFDAPAEVARLGLDDVVEFIPAVSHGESLGYLRAADVLLVIQPATRVQVPAKLYEYLWARKPILALASDDGAVSDLVRESAAGVVVGSEDEAAIADALRALYADRASLSSRYAASAAVLNAYEGRVLSRRLYDVFRELTENRRHKEPV